MITLGMMQDRRSKNGSQISRGRRNLSSISASNEVRGGLTAGVWSLTYEPEDKKNDDRPINYSERGLVAHT